MTAQEDRQEQAQIDMEAANERVYKALHGEEQQTAQSIGLVAPKPTRAPRKDKGSKRVKPEPPAAAMGKLSGDQAQKLMNLLAEKEIARVQWESATAMEEDTNAKFVDADAAVLAFIRDHTA